MHRLILGRIDDTLFPGDHTAVASLPIRHRCRSTKYPEVFAVRQRESRRFRSGVGDLAGMRLDAQRSLPAAVRLWHRSTKRKVIEIRCQLNPNAIIGTVTVPGYSP